MNENEQKKLAEQFNTARVSREFTAKHNTIAEKIRGADDVNLRQISEALKVDIGVSKTTFTISGAEQAAKATQDIIRRLSTKAKKEDITPDIIAAMLVDHEQAEGSAKITVKGRTTWAKTETQSRYIDLLQSGEDGEDSKKDIVFGIGPAGTGKTYLAIMAAAAALLSGKCKKIILSRPTVEAGEKLGFLPGDLNAKMDPYMRPLYDALREVMSQTELDRAMEDDKIEIAPLAFMRGRTLKNAVIVLDEAQNATREQLKMALTRIGEKSRMIITGDITQIDLPKNTPSGLKEFIPVLKKRIEQGRAPGIGLQEFSQSDVVRHPIIEMVVDIYDEIEGNAQPEITVGSKRSYTNGHARNGLSPT